MLNPPLEFYEKRLKECGLSPFIFWDNNKIYIEGDAFVAECDFLTFRKAVNTAYKYHKNFKCSPEAYAIFWDMVDGEPI